MGSDDLHKKRKAKKQAEIQRRQARRHPYDRVLIVCEGATELLYFEGLKRVYELHTVDITTNPKASDPLNIVKYAEKLYKQAEKDNNPFDRVYCVFDKDTHANYDYTLQYLNNLNANNKTKNKFFAINSVPCFEYWLILHFSPTTAPFTASNVIKKLKDDYFPEYSKTNPNIFNHDRLKGKLNIAITNAKSANINAQNNQTDNPSTKVVELVEYLINLK